MGALDVVSSWPVPTVAVAVVDRTGVVQRSGPDTPLPWASVTKPLSALAVLIAVDRGDVLLDEPAGPPGSTVRHLLAHASGLPFEGDGPVGTPGNRRIYSNRGFEELAAFVSARAGVPFDVYVRDLVLRPLGMSGTRLAGTAAAGAVGPIGDLAALGRELLEPTLVPDLMPAATRPVFPGLAGVLPGYGRQDPNDWGLGFEIRDGKKPHWTGTRNSPETFGHFGASGTFLWVDPRAGLACACLTDRDFGEWALPLWPDLSDRVLAEYA